MRTVLACSVLVLAACQQAQPPQQQQAPHPQPAALPREDVRAKGGQLPITVRHELSLGEDGRWRLAVIATPQQELPAMTWRLSHLERAELAEGAGEGSETAWPAGEERRWSFVLSAEVHVPGTDAPFAAFLLQGELAGRPAHRVHVAHLTATPPLPPPEAAQPNPEQDSEVLTPGRRPPAASPEPIQELRPMGEAVRTP